MTRPRRKRAPAPAAVARVAAALCLIAAALSPLDAQVPVPVERVSFQEAISRAIAGNPSVAVAAAGILRAEGLLQQARSATGFQLTGNVTTTTLNTGTEFQDTTVQPRNQLALSATAGMPILAAAAWARRAEAADNRQVAELGVADVRRQIAFATADAYLTVIAQHRAVETTVIARDAAHAHYDLASELERGGRGSRLNALRAQQQWSTDEGLVERANLGLYRAQEALGVLIVANGPVDSTDEPAFDVPPDPGSLIQFRSDLKLFSAERSAAERVVHDSSKDYWPTLGAAFQPQVLYPPQFFSPSVSWRFLLQLNVPIFDSGLRAGATTQRRAALDVAQATFAGAMTQASSEVRAARAAVASGERILASAREGSGQAQQVVDITNVSFRAGAVTNIEVIDAERTARDASFGVALAEDSLRRARLELLTALGRFP